MPTCLQNAGACLSDLFREIGKRWWVMTLGWYVCSVYTAAYFKAAKDKSMVSIIGNLCVGFPLLIPFAFCADRRCRRLAESWHKVFAIAIFAGLEKNLTNTSTHYISGSLKTALHGFNMVFSFLATALLGLDDASIWCIKRCRCCGDNMFLTLSILMVAAGSVVMTIAGEQTSEDFSDFLLGVALQLGSGIAFALKFTAIKFVLGRGKNEDYVDPDKKPPSRAQIAVVTVPMIGLTSVAFWPLDDHQHGFGIPDDSILPCVVAGVMAVGIILFQLRLTELTNPVTVSILAVFKDALILTYLLTDKNTGESFTKDQVLGYTMSAIGAIFYVRAKKNQLNQNIFDDRYEDDDGRSVSSYVEQHLNASDSTGSSVEMRA
eukprot:TRINITY_DN83881_c0_g1_i1.p1 TRINITY_DN83881_c0_g1~~TRINITY_DN83881_c0_g1_i1.p1  ORF type:complete len:376 (+),score=38.23 TRINITY_DN83881_c0_g1_i1:97-1224(+)